MLLFNLRLENGERMFILIDSKICRRDVDLNAAKSLFNLFDNNCQAITVSLKFKLSGDLSQKLFKTRLISLL